MPGAGLPRGCNVYATQFHPELDLAGLHTRIDTYATFGYFDPSEAGALSAAGAAVEVLHPMSLLRNFAGRYFLSPAGPSAPRRSGGARFGHQRHTSGRDARRW